MTSSTSPWYYHYVHSYYVLRTNLRYPSPADTHSVDERGIRLSSKPSYKSYTPYVNINCCLRKCLSAPSTPALGTRWSTGVTVACRSTADIISLHDHACHGEIPALVLAMPPFSGSCPLVQGIALRNENHPDLASLGIFV